MRWTTKVWLRRRSIYLLTLALSLPAARGVHQLRRHLQAEMALSYVFIAHDLSVVRHLSHRVAVMYLGKLVEVAATGETFLRPQHPYTKALLEAMPLPDPDLAKSRETPSLLDDELPSPLDPPTGCLFHTRCPIRRVPGVCNEQEPCLERHGEGENLAACHFAGDW